MIDKIKIVTYLDDLNLRVQQLKDIRVPKEKLLPDSKERLSVERCLYLAIQDVINISQCIVAGLSLKMPESYEGIISLLGEKGIMPQEFIDKIKKMAGFRNILEHLYVKLDVDRLYEFQYREKDFEEFARMVEEVLKKYEESPEED